MTCNNPNIRCFFPAKNAVNGLYLCGSCTRDYYPPLPVMPSNESLREEWKADLKRTSQQRKGFKRTEKEIQAALESLLSKKKELREAGIKIPDSLHSEIWRLQNFEHSRASRRAYRQRQRAA